MADLRRQVQEGVSASPLVEVLLRDIAQRREAEQKLDFAQSWIQMAQETGGVAAYHFDLVTNQLTWSASNYALYGWDAAEPASLERWLASVHPDDRPAVEQVAREAIEQGRQVRHVFRILRPDGSIRWIQDSGRVEIDHAGRPLRVVGLNIDITELNLARAALEESEALYRFTFEHAAVGVAHVGLDGRFLRVNPRLCTLLGRDEATLLGLDFQAITHPDDLDDDMQQLGQLMSGELDSYEMEKRYLRPSGEVVWGCLSVSLRRAEDGTPLNFISVVSDISPRKAAEAQLDYVMGEVSHRSKNLLSVFQAVVRLSARESGSVKDFESALMQRLKDLSMASDLLVAIERRRTIAEIVRQQLTVFTAGAPDRLDAHGPEIELTPAAAQCLGLAFFELATNACKHGALSRPDGRVSLI